MHAFRDVRFIFGLIGGVVIALGLFIFMHWLIASGNTAPNVQQQIDLVGFVHVERQPEVITKERVPPPPPPPKKQPELTQVKTQVQSNVPQQQLPVNIEFDANSLGGGAGVYINPNAGPATNASGYAPLTPMVRFRPLYPPRAAARGVAGSITTCFTVEPDGSVSNPYVTDATSPVARRLLSQSALKTIRQWKFFPKKVNGKPVATGGVCQDIEFKLGQR